MEQTISGGNLVGDVSSDIRDPDDMIKFLQELAELMHQYDIDKIDVGWKRTAVLCADCGEKATIEPAESAGEVRDDVDKGTAMEILGNVVEKQDSAAENQPEIGEPEDET